MVAMHNRRLAIYLTPIFRWALIAEGSGKARAACTAIYRASDFGMIFYVIKTYSNILKIRIMLTKRRNYTAPAGGLLLAGLAAFAYYKYSKLTVQEKQDLVSNLKERGRKLFGQAKDMYNNKFEQGSMYTG